MFLLDFPEENQCPCLVQGSEVSSFSLVCGPVLTSRPNPPTSASLSCLLLRLRPSGLPSERTLSPLTQTIQDSLPISSSLTQSYLQSPFCHFCDFVTCHSGLSSALCPVPLLSLIFMGVRDWDADAFEGPLLCLTHKHTHTQNKGFE